MKKIVGFIFFLQIFSIVQGQQLNPYLHCDEIRREFAACFDGTDLSQCDFALAWYSFIGLVDSAIAVDNIRYNRVNPTGIFDSTLERFSPSPAIDYILDHAGGEKVVMLNEQHYYVPDRIFTTEILIGLKKLGFNYLGCEGLWNTDSLVEKGYPTTKMGEYLAEPQYSNLIRVALSLGFHVFSYEQPGPGGHREIGQAQAIYDILKNDSSAKIVIHAGLGHIRKDTTLQKAMGFYFKLLSGINPYTINQASMIEHGMLKCESPVYQQLSNKIKEPAVMYSSGSKKFFGDSCYDLVVFHPRTEYIDGRAKWLYDSYLYKYRFKIPDKADFPLLLKVYVKEQYEKDEFSIPVDVIELLTKQNFVDLFVPLKGNYAIVLDGGLNKPSLCFFNK